MAAKKTTPIIGEPRGWTPLTELEHFMQCPVCGEMLDCRDLAQALKHWHDGPKLDRHLTVTRAKPA